MQLSEGARSMSRYRLQKGNLLTHLTYTGPGHWDFGIIRQTIPRA